MLEQHNVLISDSGDAYIADFGLSEIFAEFEPDIYSSAWLNGGLPNFQSPELLCAIEGVTIRRTTWSDIFSFGRLILEVNLVAPS